MFFSFIEGTARMSDLFALAIFSKVALDFVMALKSGGVVAHFWLLALGICTAYPPAAVFFSFSLRFATMAEPRAVKSAR